MYKKDIKLPMYNTLIRVIACTGPVKAGSITKGYTELNACYKGVCAQLYPGTPNCDHFVLVHIAYPSVGTLVHELTHAANYTLGYTGVQACFDNDEAQAHLIGHLVDCLDLEALFESFNPNPKPDTD